MMQLLTKLFFTVAALGVLLTPVWFFLGARSFLNPEGFFQEFFVFGVGIWLLGTVQLLFLIFLCAVLIIIWKNR